MIVYNTRWSLKTGNSGYVIEQKQENRGLSPLFKYVQSAHTGFIKKIRKFTRSCGVSPNLFNNAVFRPSMSLGKKKRGMFSSYH